MVSIPIRLTRDCAGAVVPSGERIELHQGESVVVSQALGGSFTVMTEDGYFGREGEVLVSGIPARRPIAGGAPFGEVSENRVRCDLGTSR